jgi:hypothetical protein
MGYFNVKVCGEDILKPTIGNQNLLKNNNYN